MSERVYDINKIIESYLKYLNGPLGKGVMEYLWEGASFTVRTKHEMLQVLKYGGKAVINVIEENDIASSDVINELS
ncbi:MAG: hypothetical protein OEV85_09620 [Candidatus Thorarchaeota archaeon]|nr:hypothetical protein [Candidatus Thorarchaeota archaeon]